MTVYIYIYIYILYFSHWSMAMVRVTWLSGLTLPEFARSAPRANNWPRSQLDTSTYWDIILFQRIASHFTHNVSHDAGQLGDRRYCSLLWDGSYLRKVLQMVYFGPQTNFISKPHVYFLSKFCWWHCKHCKHGKHSILSAFFKVSFIARTITIHFVP